MKYHEEGVGSPWYPRFRNQETGHVTAFDPRIDWTQLEVEPDDPWKDWLLSEEYGQPLRRPDEEYLLRNHPDLKIETFNLI